MGKDSSGSMEISFNFPRMLITLHYTTLHHSTQWTSIDKDCPPVSASPFSLALLSSPIPVNRSGQARSGRTPAFIHLSNKHTRTPPLSSTRRAITEPLPVSCIILPHSLLSLPLLGRVRIVELCVRRSCVLACCLYANPSSQPPRRHVL